MTSRIAAAWLAGLLMAVGCAPAARQTPESAPVAEPAPPPPIDVERHAELYEELADAMDRYQLGVDLVAEGSEVDGEWQIRRAMDAIAAGFSECRSSAGCDLNRYYYGFERMLTQQGVALKLQAGRIAELEAFAEVADEAAAAPALVAAEIDAPFDGDTGTAPTAPTDPRALQEQATQRLHGNDLRDLITLNKHVKAALDDWLTWMRPQLLETWENYQYLRPQIAPVYEQAGLPEALLFGMIATETNGKVHAVSHAGAKGLLQFIRHTGSRYGLREEDGFDRRFDPVAATQANVDYLNDLFGMLNNDLEKALAAYNGGENRIKRLDRRFGTPSFWDDRFYWSLPRETRDYVPRIFAAAWLFLHAEDYNLSWPELETSQAELELERESSLTELTVCLGETGNPQGWFRTLRNLNPRIEPQDRIPAGQRIAVPAPVPAIYARSCVDEALLTRARELYEANYPAEPEVISYTVRPGDTLGKIAARHRCTSLRQLAELNRVRPPSYTITVGQRLKIPSCG